MLSAAAVAVAAVAVVVATGEQRECWTGEGRLDSGGDGHGLTTLECRSAAVAVRGNIPLFFSYF